MLRNPAHRIPVSQLLVLASCCLQFGLTAVSAPRVFGRPPNIVYILADDLGYGDVSCNNSDSKVQTANIDRLAKQGMRFTDAHSPSAVCTPTRYGILTGRYCWRTRLKYRVLDGFDPPLIEPGQVTVASLLKAHGYNTGCVGKWHLGMEWTTRDGRPMPAAALDRRTPPRVGDEVDYEKAIKRGPNAVGFDWYFGISASLNMSPFCYLENDRPVLLPTTRSPAIKTEFISVDEGMRSPDFSIAGVMPRLTGAAIQFIQRSATQAKKQGASRKPFFLYFPLTAPHLPAIPNEEFRGTSRAGTYGDFVVEVDATVGAIMQSLDRLELAEETLLIVTSDNGGLYHWWEPQETDDVKHYNPTRRGRSMKEYGHQGNAHLRGTKADIWEGGHRVPFVARWPGVIEAGARSDALIELTDLLATCAEIVAADLPSGAGLDSRSILPVLVDDKARQPVREVAVHHSLWGVFAMREGPWKMIPHRGSGGFTRLREIQPAPGEPVGQLYHLQRDPSETNNVWNKHPDIVAGMLERLKKIQAPSPDSEKPAASHPEARRPER